MYVGAKVMPSVLITGAVYVGLQELINPVSPEQAAILEQGRRKRKNRFTSPVSEPTAPRDSFSEIDGATATAQSDQ